MKLIIGLGNPGKKFGTTRHNIGFTTVEDIAKLSDASWKLSKKFDAEIAEAILSQQDVTLVKPQTFMNESGRAAASISEYFGIEPAETVVISDDLNLPVGDFRIRFGGGDGGHNGLKSIIAAIGPNFWRVRIGVGQNSQEPAEKYVLKQLSIGEKKQIDKVVDKVAQYLVNLSTKGLKEETLKIL